MPLLLAPSDSHVLVAKAFGPGKRILDLGSGAGFPGLILAATTEAEFILTEARRKRASFLAIASASMGLRNVRVDNRYQAGFTSEFDVVTARAFAKPADLLSAHGFRNEARRHSNTLCHRTSEACDRAGIDRR